MVIPGRTGALYPPGDSARLADALRTLLSEPDRLASMGDNARRMATDEFSPEMHLRGLLQVYREVAA